MKHLDDSARVVGRVLTAVVLCMSVACGVPQTPPPENDNVTPAAKCGPGAALAPATVSYSLDVMPICERAGCLTSGCHGPLAESSFSLLTYDGMFGPGLQAKAFGLCAVVPGRPQDSYILEKLRPTPRSGEQMPQDRDPLTAEEIATIETWIAEGAQEN